MTPSQAAQENPTSPRPDRCDWIEVGQPYPNECGRTLPCDRHGGDAEGHPFGFVNLARQHAEGTVAALQAAGFSDDDMVRFLDAVEASGLTLIPREAAGKDAVSAGADPTVYPGTEEQMERDHYDAARWREHTILVFCERCIDGFVNSAGTEPCPDCFGTGRIRVCPHMWEGAPEDE